MVSKVMHGLFLFNHRMLLVWNQDDDRRGNIHCRCSFGTGCSRCSRRPGKLGQALLDMLIDEHTVAQGCGKGVCHQASEEEYQTT